MIIIILSEEINLVILVNLIVEEKNALCAKGIAILRNCAQIHVQ